MEKFKQNREKIGSILFLIGITIECFFMLYNLGAYPVPTWLNVGRCVQVAVACFCIKIVLTKYSWKEITAIAGAFIFGVISYIATGKDEWVLRVFFLIIASKDMDVVKVARYVFRVCCVGGVGILLLSIFGVGAPMINAIDYGRGVGIENRWSFGMGHPNHFHGFVCYMVTLLLFLYHERCKLYHYIIMTVVNVGLFLLTVSRAGFIITELVILAFVAVQYIHFFQNAKLWLVLGLAAVLGTVALTVYAGFCGTEGPILSKLDRMMTGRLTFIDWYGDPKTWRWFSQSDDIGRATIDVAYGAIINAYGYAVCIVYTLINCLLVIRYYFKRNIAGLIVILSCIVYGMMENYLNSYFLMYNLIFIMLFGNWDKLLHFKEV